MYIKYAETICGPYTDEQIRQCVAEGRLLPENAVSYDGRTWQSASRVPGLFDDTKPGASPIAARLDYTQPFYEQSDLENPYAPPVVTPGSTTEGANYNTNSVTDPNITFWQAYKHGWTCLSSRGRARRKEAWAWNVINAAVYFCMSALAVIVYLIFIPEDGPVNDLVDAYFPTAFATTIVVFTLVAFIPTFLLQIRRFHDFNFSGLLVFLVFVPNIGGLLLLVFDCIDGTVGPNRYGPDPKGRVPGRPDSP